MNYGTAAWGIGLAIFASVTVLGSFGLSWGTAVLGGAVWGLGAFTAAMIGSAGIAACSSKTRAFAGELGCSSAIMAMIFAALPKGPAVQSYNVMKGQAHKVVDSFVHQAAPQAVDTRRQRFAMRTQAPESGSVSSRDLLNQRYGRGGK